MLSRRNFLKVCAFTSAGIAIPQFYNYPANAQWLTVGRMLLRFAGAVGTSVVADQVSDWVSDLFDDRRTPAREIVINTNNMMVENDFNDFSDSQVFYDGSTRTYFYNVNFADGFNACAPFYVRRGSSGTTHSPNRLNNPVLVEGPVIMGLYLASRDWTHRRIERDNSLIPLDQVEGGTGAVFEEDFNEPKIYETNEGYLGVDYEVDSIRNNRGQLRVEAVQANANDRQLDTIFSGEYPIQWRT